MVERRIVGNSVKFVLWGALVLWVRGAKYLAVGCE